MLCIFCHKSFYTNITVIINLKKEMLSMENKYETKITTQDRLLRAWENSMELVRDFEKYSQEIKDDKEVARLFAEYAEEEGVHAAKFRETLYKYQH